jgi:hypothetical protein
MATVQPTEIPDEVYRRIELKAKNDGVTIQQEIARLLERAISEDEKEASLIAQVRRERQELAATGVYLTDSFLAEAKAWGRK